MISVSEKRRSFAGKMVNKEVEYFYTTKALASFAIAEKTNVMPLN